jgi:hypothetical protein
MQPAPALASYLPGLKTTHLRSQQSLHNSKFISKWELPELTIDSNLEYLESEMLRHPLSKLWHSKKLVSKGNARFPSVASFARGSSAKTRAHRSLARTRDLKTAKSGRSTLTYARSASAISTRCLIAQLARTTYACTALVTSSELSSSERRTLCHCRQRIRYTSPALTAL